MATKERDEYEPTGSDGGEGQSNKGDEPGLGNSVKAFVAGAGAAVVGAGSAAAGAVTGAASTVTASIKKAFSEESEVSAPCAAKRFIFIPTQNNLRSCFSSGSFSLPHVVLCVI
jgi:hypothetical protein